MWRKLLFDCTLKTIARHIGMIMLYIKAICSADEHNLTEYLNNYRISQACYLLKKSNQYIEKLQLIVAIIV